MAVARVVVGLGGNGLPLVVGDSGQRSGRLLVGVAAEGVPTLCGQVRRMNMTTATMMTTSTTVPRPMYIRGLSFWSLIRG
jgi:hypothetical protein